MNENDKMNDKNTGGNLICSELSEAASIIDINSVMKLAKLDLNDPDAVGFSSEMEKILDYINLLKDADTVKIENIAGELDYDSLTGNGTIKTEFYRDCRKDVCMDDPSFDFTIVMENAPSFEVSVSVENESKETSGFFAVPQVIE